MSMFGESIISVMCHHFVTNFILFLFIIFKLQAYWAALSQRKKDTPEHTHFQVYVCFQYRRHVFFLIKLSVQKHHLLFQFRKKSNHFSLVSFMFDPCITSIVSMTVLFRQEIKQQIIWKDRTIYSSSNNPSYISRETCKV